jgi:hypothetical protein
LTFCAFSYNQWLLLAQNWPKIMQLLLAADVDANGRVRLTDVSSVLQRVPALSPLTPSSSSAAAALLDMDGIGSIHPDSLSFIFALPVLKSWLTPLCSEALEMFRRAEVKKGVRLVSAAFL